MFTVSVPSLVSLYVIFHSNLGLEYWNIFCKVKLCQHYLVGLCLNMC